MSSAPNSGHLVIGLGSGRSGTASLASLIDRQPGGLCFHEMNPSCSVFSGNPQTAVNTVSELRRILDGGDRARLSIDYSRPMSVQTYDRLQGMERVDLLGDIAYYYLNYVDDILQAVPSVRFVCIKRDREQTVASWLNKTSIRRWRSLWLADRLKSLITRTPFYREYNHWQEHDGSTFKPDPVWDSCFPKIEAASKEEAIRMYWDQYYRQAEELAARLPQSFRIFDISDLSDEQGQLDILRFIGLPDSAIQLSGDVHLHRSR